MASSRTWPQATGHSQQGIARLRIPFIADEEGIKGEIDGSFLVIISHQIKEKLAIAKVKISP